MSDLEPARVELRRAARERALEILYEAEIKGATVEDLLAGLPLAPADLALELVRGVQAHRAKIDEALEKRVAPRWSLARLAAVDRAVLRLATYELMHEPERPAAVVLNEAVVLVRRFGTDDSPRFVNGVLSAVAADVRPQQPGPWEDDAGAGGSVRPAVDALVMDLDGVIRHWDEAALAEGEASLDLPEGAIAAAAFEATLLERAMRGELSAQEWFAAIGAEVADAHQVDAQAVVEVMAGVGWTIDESVMELVDLARRRVPVALLSNASSRLVDDVRLSGLLDRFDAVVGSADLGVLKPDAAAFEAAAEAIGAAPGRCMMVDDREVNVAGAAALGMRAVLFTGVEELTAELEAVGLIDPVSDVDRDPAP